MFRRHFSIFKCPDINWGSGQPPNAVGSARRWFLEQWFHVLQNIDRSENSRESEQRKRGGCHGPTTPTRKMAGRAAEMECWKFFISYLFYKGGVSSTIKELKLFINSVSRTRYTTRLAFQSNNIIQGLVPCIINLERYSKRCSVTCKSLTWKDIYKGKYKLAQRSNTLEAFWVKCGNDHFLYMLNHHSVDVSSIFDFNNFNNQMSKVDS